MTLNLPENYKEQLRFLSTQSEEVVKNVCQSTQGCLRKELGAQSAAALAKQCGIDASIVKSIIECLTNFWIESCKLKLTDEQYQEVLKSLNFKDPNLQVLTEFYNTNKNEINLILSENDIRFTEYHDLNWRFEVQVGSRSVLQQTVPLVTMDLAVKNNEKDKQIEHIILQTDPNNLQHLSQELEMALQEGRSQHSRNIAKIIK